jgi:hypothetical protein
VRSFDNQVFQLACAIDGTHDQRVFLGMWGLPVVTPQDPGHQRTLVIDPRLMPRLGVIETDLDPSDAASSGISNPL